MSVPDYPEYKDSGVSWVGKVPKHWDVASLKRRVAIVGGSTPKSDVDDFWDGDIPWITPADLSRLADFYINNAIRCITADGLASCGTTMVPAGSVILSTRAPIGSLGIAAVDLCTNQGCKALVPAGVESKFLAYVLSICSAQLNVRGRGSTFLELSADELGVFPLPFPSKAEQTAISAFLDRETAKIDALVAEQERLIALLKEKRQAVISHAVTKGLNPHAPMKDSGIEWLGEIPAHWDVVPLKTLTPVDRAIMYGIVLPGPDVGEGVPIVKGGDVKGNRLKRSLLCYTTPEIEAPFARARLKSNDIVYSIRGSIGDAELVPIELEDANITQDVARISPIADVNTHWLLQAMRSKPIFVQLEQRSLGAAVRGINIFDLKRAAIPLPPREEQDAIAAQLQLQCERLADLEREMLEAITLLQERRAALVSAAVTGKIDVRGLVYQQELEAA